MKGNCNLSRTRFFQALLSVAFLLFISAVPARACTNFFGAGCSFSANGQHYIKFDIDPTSYNCFVANVWNNWSATTSVSAKIYNTGSPSPSVPILSATPSMIGSSFYVPVPFYSGTYIAEVTLIATGPTHYSTQVIYDVNNTSDIQIPIYNTCPSVPYPNSNKISACFKRDQNHPSGFSVTVDGSFTLYQTFNSYTPVLEFLDPAAPTITYGPFPVTATVGQTLYFDVSSAYGLDPNKCYQIVVYFKDQNGNPITDWMYDNERVCMCATCDAAFTLTTYPYASNPSSFVLDMMPYQSFSNTVNELWEVTGGGTTHYSDPLLASIILPYGSYTACHTVWTAEGKTCKVCYDFCFTKRNENEPGGQGGDPAERRAPAEKNGTGNKAVNAQSFKLEPNPASSSATASFELKQEGKASILVLDQTGRVVSVIENKTYHAGQNKVEINTSGLATGVYNIRIQSTEGSFFERLSVVK